MITYSVEHAAELLQHGQVLAYPTEAVWGLGCDPMNQQAFQKILALKQRPIEKGVILLASDVEQVEALLAPLDQTRQQEIIASWHNRQAHERGLTWLLPNQTAIPEWITGQHPRVAVRVTNHPLCQQLCRAFGSFIVSTSANPAGLDPACNLEQAQAYFADQLDYLDGELGQSPLPSRIIDAVTGQVIRD
ncbi:MULTISPECIES: L-threonylcarbamoyladenylate synthase [Acinetobacter]|jgi:L-threonylcarbamoyladenylate synthase|uniref:L-threonylcarbamoyladenylate synthase n=1 Tax=Acinetobacter TaxID=469 RepID=UPI0002D02CC8|nr:MULTISPECIES: Sua5/YciO/YrdC/YwlC family protein [Acinetobacter]ENU79180.1 Sua5/YciO/YrdC/YwlC family protein [Acinetobacter sp. ANC 3789]KJV39291.1 tRNA threonylcarbamoyladenosine biosynthesis protein RimN [Acinetobacter brisouii]TCB24884.1 tRNA threonylcarbamoyladenosine biosynthesis protein RimN [Acinetobacter sp. ANC 4635]